MPLEIREDIYLSVIYADVSRLPRPTTRCCLVYPTSSPNNGIPSSLYSCKQVMHEAWALFRRHRCLYAYHEFAITIACSALSVQGAPLTSIRQLTLDKLRMSIHQDEQGQWESWGTERNLRRLRDLLPFLQHATLIPRLAFTMRERSWLGHEEPERFIPGYLVTKALVTAIHPLIDGLRSFVIAPLQIQLEHLSCLDFRESFSGASWPCFMQKYALDFEGRHVQLVTGGVSLGIRYEPEDYTHIAYILDKLLHCHSPSNLGS